MGKIHFKLSHCASSRHTFTERGLASLFLYFLSSGWGGQGGWELCLDRLPYKGVRAFVPSIDSVVKPKTPAMTHLPDTVLSIQSSVLDNILWLVVSVYKTFNNNDTTLMV